MRVPKVLFVEGWLPELRPVILTVHVLGFVAIIATIVLKVFTITPPLFVERTLEALPVCSIAFAVLGYIFKKEAAKQVPVTSRSQPAKDEDTDLGN